MYSPMTNKKMILHTEDRILNNKTYIHHFYLCEDTGERFTTTELDEINMNQINLNIKFKFWDNTKKEMLQDYCNSSYQELFNNQNIIPIPYTNIKDINGNELYLGDICKVENWYPSDYKELGFIGQVLYVDGKFYIYNVAKYSYSQELYTSAVKNRNITKLGNIYENPELL
jgi:hypothetical protein